MLIQTYSVFEKGNDKNMAGAVNTYAFAQASTGVCCAYFHCLCIYPGTPNRLDECETSLGNISKYIGFQYPGTPNRLDECETSLGNMSKYIGFQ